MAEKAIHKSWSWLKFKVKENNIFLWWE